MQTDSYQVTALRGENTFHSRLLTLVLLSVTFPLIRLPWQAQSVDVYVAFSMTALQWDKMVLCSLLTSTDQPSTRGSSTGTRILAELSRMSIQRWCSALSPRTAAAIEAAATSRNLPESDKPASSLPLCCVAFSTRRRVPWANERQRRASSKTAPLINIWAARLGPRPRRWGPPSIPSRWDKCQDMPRLFEARLLRWARTSR